MDAILGRKVLNHVTEHREQFDMGFWGSIRPSCGTVACLAGWTLLKSGWRLAGFETFISPEGVTVTHDFGRHASELLNLTVSEYEGVNSDGEEASLFSENQSDDEAIARFRALVEAAEAAGKGN